jgi:hypothetical protein
MFYNARWYDPALGRFAQADSIIPPGVQGLDRYAYVNNSPMNYVDPTGHINGRPCELRGECEKTTYDDESDRLPISTPKVKPKQQTSRSDTSIGPTIPQKQNENTPEPNFEFYTEFYTWLSYLDDAFTFLDNYGRPFYKHAKGVIPAGFRAEFIAGFVITGLADLNNPNLTIGQRLGRATITGIEDGLTEIAATKVATFLTPFGIEAGALIAGVAATPETFGAGTLPAATIGGGAGGFSTFVGASYVTTRAIDTIIWKPINETFFPGLFP